MANRPPVVTATDHGEQRERDATDHESQEADRERRDGDTDEGARRPGRSPQDRGGDDEPGCARGVRGARTTRGEGAQKVALSPQAHEPDEFGLSMEKPEASSDSFQSIVAPVR